MVLCVCCPQCKSSELKLHEVFSKKHGFASLFQLSCRSNSFILQNNVTEGMKLIEELFMLCVLVDKVTQGLRNSLH